MNYRIQFRAPGEGYSSVVCNKDAGMFVWIGIDRESETELMQLYLRHFRGLTRVHSLNSELAMVNSQHLKYMKAKGLYVKDRMYHPCISVQMIWVRPKWVEIQSIGRGECWQATNGHWVPLSNGNQSRLTGGLAYGRLVDRKRINEGAFDALYLGDEPPSDALLEKGLLATTTNGAVMLDLFQSPAEFEQVD